MTPSRQAVAVAFLAGCIAGVIGGGLLQRRAMRRWSHGPDTQRLVGRLSRQLSLDDAQQTAVKAALERRRGEMDALHRQTFARMEEIRKGFLDEIQPLLKPDQKERLEKLKARWAERRRKLGPPPPPPAPPEP